MIYEAQNKKRIELESVLAEHRIEFFNFLVRRLRNEADAQDVLQEAYLKICRITDVKEIVKPKAYLFRILSNLAYDRMKQNTTHKLRYVSEIAECEEMPDATADVEKIVYYRNELRSLQKALNQLSYKCRMSFVLHRAAKCTYSEVGNKLGISESMAKKYVYKALIHCRQYMLDQEGFEF